MTLCTHVFIRDHLEPMQALAKARELVGADEETEMHLHANRYGDAGTWRAGNEAGQGLCALLDVFFRPEGPLREQVDEDYGPACWLEVSFDTAYGYAGENGEDCGRLHARLVAELGAWLDGLGVAWLWQNEFTGEIHEGYDRLPDLAGGGEDARDWFSWVVRPAIEASGGEAV